MTDKMEVAESGKRKQKTKMGCIVCGKLYVSQYYMRRHLALHILCPAVPTQRCCAYCGSQFATSASYVEHMEEVDKNIDNAKSNKFGKRRKVMPEQEEVVASEPIVMDVSN